MPEPTLNPAVDETAGAAEKPKKIAKSAKKLYAVGSVNIRRDGKLLKQGDTLLLDNEEAEHSNLAPYITLIKG